MHTLTGTLRNWDLTGELNAGRKYIVVMTNFGLFRKYFEINIYNPFDGTGSQRKAKKAHINKLRSEISSGNYTPTCFNSHLNKNTVVKFKESNVHIDLSEENKLSIEDGGSRLAALNLLREENSDLQEKIDSLPIETYIYLDGDNKQDFLNLNFGSHVKKSHILSMQIDSKKSIGDKFNTLVRASDLCKLLNNNDSNIFHNTVSFGHVDGGRLALNVLCSDRKGDMISNLFGSAKILNKYDKSNDYFLEKVIWLHKYINKNTKAVESGKLLVLPDGPRGNFLNFIGVVNCIIYYLYIKETVKIDDGLLKNSLEVYNDYVSGDLSSKRRQTLIGAFAQNLFHEMEEDPDSIIGFHSGVPTSLCVLTSYSSFGLDNPGRPLND